MSGFAPLISVLMEHEYFVDSRCQIVSCEPDPGTLALARNCELVLKMHIDGVTVYLDQNRTDALKLAIENPTSPPELWFRLHTEGRSFSNCTDPSTPRGGAVLLFSNAAGEPEAGSARQSLAKGNAVSEADFVPITDTALAEILTARDRRIPPLAFVRIVLRDLAPRRYVLRFEARQTFWKYYLLGGQARTTAKIVDKAQKIEFEAGVETTLADNRRAVSFTSKARIPLRQQSDQHFQLLETESDVGKPLTQIERLPVASADRLIKDTINGHDTLVSDIYINC